MEQKYLRKWSKNIYLDFSKDICHNFDCYISYVSCYQTCMPHIIFNQGLVRANPKSRQIIRAAGIYFCSPVS